MSFKDKIEARRNTLLDSLNACKLSGLKTYIYGNGAGADSIEKRNLFSFDGRLVNKSYINQKYSNVFCFEEILEHSNEKINLIVGFKDFKDSLIEKYRDKINILINCDCLYGNLSVDSDMMSYSFVEENESNLEKVYNSLEDEKSRTTLIAYINQKISRDYKYLKQVFENNQYFPEDIIKLNNNEIFVDCGAFIGDTVETFINQCEKHNILYKKIISFEPDPINYQKLKDKSFKNHECLNFGTSDHKGLFHFTIDKSSSYFDPNGDIEVEINTIDNIIKDKVTYIKMDIEGMELASLKGAEKTIKKYKPKLAICIYHKNEDLWEIQNYLKSIVPEYKFYIRAHREVIIELVLYAIP